MPILEKLERIAVIGTSCSGKSTLSRNLSEILNQPHIELDALHWGPGWTPRPPEEFQSDVSQAVSADRWIVDGNYSSVLRNSVLQQATALIWLNYSFYTIFSRAVIRTARRVILAEELYAGNRETVSKSFFSRESILWWVISTYERRRKQYRELRESGQYQQLAWIEFRHPQETERFLTSLSNRSGA
jgi:adenylate kinase family enzyme